MKIVIKEHPHSRPQYKYIAQNPDAPGSSPVGYGSTCKEALGDFIYHNATGMKLHLELPQEEYDRIADEAAKER